MEHVYLNCRALKRNWPPDPSKFNLWCVSGFDLPTGKAVQSHHSKRPLVPRMLPQSKSEAIAFLERWKNTHVPFPYDGGHADEYCLSIEGLAAAHYLTYATGASEQFRWPKTFASAVDMFSMRFKTTKGYALIHDYQVQGGVKSLVLFNLDVEAYTTKNPCVVHIENVSGFLLTKVTP